METDIDVLEWAYCRDCDARPEGCRDCIIAIEKEEKANENRN